jgi:hypothetical protein
LDRFAPPFAGYPQQHDEASSREDHEQVWQQLGVTNVGLARDGVDHDGDDDRRGKDEA